jgi:hypothetical protein
MSFLITYKNGNNNITKELGFAGASNPRDYSNSLVVIALRTFLKVFNNIDIIFISKLREIQLREYVRN